MRPTLDVGSLSTSKDTKLPVEYQLCQLEVHLSTRLSTSHFVSQ
jgi:hypothetical protein